MFPTDDDELRKRRMMGGVGGMLLPAFPGSSAPGFGASPGQWGAPQAPQAFGMPRLPQGLLGGMNQAPPAPAAAMAPAPQATALAPKGGGLALNKQASFSGGGGGGGDGGPKPPKPKPQKDEDEEDEDRIFRRPWSSYGALPRFGHVLHSLADPGGYVSTMARSGEGWGGGGGGGDGGGGNGDGDGDGKKGDALKMWGTRKMPKFQWRLPPGLLGLWPKNFDPTP